MPKVEIRQLTDIDGMLILWPYLKEIPMINTTSNAVLAECLNGTSGVITGRLDDELCGFMVYQIHGENLSVIALYLPNHTKEFFDEFMVFCRAHKVKRLFAVSQAEPKAYARLLGLEILYTTFKREVN